MPHSKVDLQAKPGWRSFRNWLCFSSVVTILSVGIGTFTQLALRATACAKAVPGAAASIPIAQNYYVSSFEIIGVAGVNNSFTEASLYKLDTFMNTAIINGLAGLQSLSAVSASCDTDNCSFATHGGITHSTLGVESVCLDLTPFISQSANTSTTNVTTYSKSATDGVYEYSQVSLEWTNYSLPTRNLGGTRQMTEYLGYVVNASDEVTIWSARPWSSTMRIAPVDIDMRTTNITETYDISLSAREQRLVKSGLFQATFVIPTLNP